MSETKCKCDYFSMFVASLIYQPWLQKKSHLPATLCRCEMSYFSWPEKKLYKTKTQKGEQ